MPRRIEYENMTPDELLAYVLDRQKKSYQRSKEYISAHKEERKKYLREYIKTSVAYARSQVSYWEKQVEIRSQKS